MIVGIGCDIVKTARISLLIDKFKNRFIERIFTVREISNAKNFNSFKLNSYYAKRFAAKEAISKALGCGIGGKLSFKNIEITNLENGQPFAMINNDAFKHLKIHLSIADEKDIAIAYAIICE